MKGLDQLTRAPRRVRSVDLRDGPDLAQAYACRIVNTKTGSFKVERGVDLPEKSTYTPREVFPLEQLEVGESFWIECGPWTAQHILQQQRARQKGRAFATRQENHNGKRGLRVWRVE